MFERLEQVVERYCWEMFAFAELTNHGHLFFRTPQPNLSRGMQTLLLAPPPVSLVLAIATSPASMLESDSIFLDTEIKVCPRCSPPVRNPTKRTPGKRDLREPWISPFRSRSHPVQSVYHDPNSKSMSPDPFLRSLWMGAASE